METVAFCEMDAFCQKVLKKRWPNVPIHSDIKELDGHEYRGAVELICGGFPCQPFSVAGEQRGAEDDRALWPEMLRVICEVQPTWVIGENVSGIINMELDNVLSNLEAEGYAAQTFVLPACSVDAKHRRDRVWIVAHSNGQGEPNEGQESS
jgi:DNA (cytosine-5)-methyltransferase 1